MKRLLVLATLMLVLTGCMTLQKRQPDFSVRHTQTSYKENIAQIITRVNTPQGFVIGRGEVSIVASTGDISISPWFCYQTTCDRSNWNGNVAFVCDYTRGETRGKVMMVVPIVASRDSALIVVEAVCIPMTAEQVAAEKTQEQEKEQRRIQEEQEAEQRRTAEDEQRRMKVLKWQEEGEAYEAQERVRREQEKARQEQEKARQEREEKERQDNADVDRFLNNSNQFKPGQ